MNRINKLGYSNSWKMVIELAILIKQKTKMSPFSIFFRELRLKRGLIQKEAAMLLGYEQSYISALERSLKGPPNRGFLKTLHLKFQLTEEELVRLELEITRSKRVVTIPPNANICEYEIMNAFRMQVGRLKPKQIELLKFALTLD